MNSLLVMISTLAAFSAYAADRPVLASCQDSQNPPLETELSFGNFVRDCTLPSLGEQRSYTIRSYGWSNKTNVHIKGVASLDGKPSLEITVSIRFESENGDIKTAESMRENAQHCLEKLSPYLIGPQGEHLQIRLADRKEERSGLLDTIFHPHRLHRNKVKLAEKSVRPNSSKYNQTEDCHTIFHETLHVLGLVDEYPEWERDYSCRSIGQDSSPMYDDELALYSVQGMCHAEAYIVDCENHTADQDQLLVLEAQKFLASHKANDSLPSFSGCEVKKANPGRYDNSPLNSEGRCSVDAFAGFRPSGNRIMPAFYIPKVVPPWKKSLLSRGQFNKIVFPNCKMLNAVYDACASNAYRSKTTNGGCNSDVPAICSSPNWTEQ